MKAFKLERLTNWNKGSVKDRSLNVEIVVDLVDVGTAAVKSHTTKAN
jgi:hypothetical protein